MDGSPHRGPVEPPFGCAPFRPLADAIDTVVSRLAVVADNDGREPRYRAEGREIVTVHTGRRATPPMAREALHLMIEGILATRQDDLVAGDILRAGDLIRAIRQAERNDPLPPAAIARAA